jgi:hypothetical protein
MTGTCQFVLLAKINTKIIIEYIEMNLFFFTRTATIEMKMRVRRRTTAAATAATTTATTLKATTAATTVNNKVTLKDSL